MTKEKETDKLHKIEEISKKENLIHHKEPLKLDQKELGGIQEENSENVCKEIVHK